MARRRPDGPRWAPVAVVALLGALVLGACGSDPEAQPTIPTVDFEPRLVIVVDDAISAEAGPVPGADPVDAGWEVPDGSVTELRVEGAEARRVVAEREPLDGGEAAPLLDTGSLEPGDTVTLALTEPGRVSFRFLEDDPDEERLVVVVATSDP